MTLAPLSEEDRKQFNIEKGKGGVMVESIRPEGIAAEASLEISDIILEVNRKPVSSVKEAESLLLSSKNTLILKIKRQGMVVLLMLDKR